MNEEILKARKNVNLTQEKASNKIGVTLRTYQKYETGECTPNAKIAIKIAEVFHTTVEKLFAPNKSVNNKKSDGNQINKQKA